MNKLLKLTTAIALFAAAAVQGQIVINDNLSVTGFFDMSANRVDADKGVETRGYATDDTHYNFDQAEIDFLISFDKIKGQVDLNYLNYDGTNNGGDFQLEQAFITYDLGEGASVTAGKFLSYMGWETAEPTGLFQYSYAYDMGDKNGRGHGTIPGYHNGVTLDYTNDAGSFGIALLDSVYNADSTLSNSEYGIEAKAVFNPAEGLTIFLGYAHDAMDVGDDQDLINLWASYEIGNGTYAVEYNDYDFGGVITGNQWLAMANYTIGDNAGITFRVSQDTQDWKGGDEATKYTIAPNWTIGDNLSMLFEVSQTDFGSKEGKALSIAFETIFTF